MGRRPHGLVYGLLAASLAVNLIGVGYFGYFGYAETRKRPPRTIESTIDYVAQRYPAKVAQAFKEKLEGRRAEFTTALEDMRSARRDARGAMRRKPLNRDEVERALQVSREKSVALQIVVHRALVDALPDVPEADRGAIDKDEAD